MEQSSDASASIAPAAENNKQNGGNGLKIATAIACLVAVCGIGFGVYGVMQVSNRDSQISDLKIQIKDSNDKIAALETMKSETTDDSDTTNMTVTDSYQIFSDNLAKNYSAGIFGYYYHYNGSGNERKTVIARVKDAHLTITDADDSIIAEADDIISAYFVRLGNGGVPYFYFIKKDGGAARIDISENSARTIENLDGYEKIVSIFGCGDSICAADKISLIDINGNIYTNW